MTQNRRKFSRVSFETDAHLFLPDGEHPVQVLDLSLKGALIQPKESVYITVGTVATLKVPLAGSSNSIRMEVAVVHHLLNHYGLACRDIDLDSVTHLRRLVALNLGDEALADREFAALALD